MSDVDDALKVLKQFMKEMSAWETKTGKLIDQVEDGELELDEVEAEQMEILGKIQDAYCAVSKWRRKEFMVTCPSEYDLKGNRRISATLGRNGHLLVEFQQEHLANGVMRIEMTRIDDGWKIVRRWITINGKKIAVQL